MSSPFFALSPDQRAQQRRAYLAHVKAVDGAPDLRHGKLATREATYQLFRDQPVTYTGAVPVDEFWALYRSAGKSAHAGSSKLALWMAILARVNASEKYGVEVGKQRFDLDNLDLEDPQTYVEIEEFYHCHILGDALSVLGVSVTIEPPSLFIRAMVHMMIAMPAAVSNVVILLAEIVATTLFLELRRTALELVDTSTEAGQRILQLVEQILVDEMGHVAFVQSRMTPAQLWWARAMAPWTAPTMFRDTPCVENLYDIKELTRKALAFQWSDMPAEVRARCFAPLTAGWLEAPKAPAQAPTRSAAEAA